MQPDSMAVVLAVALHGVVGEVALCHLVVGIDDDLRGPHNRRYASCAKGFWGSVVSLRSPEKCSSQV